MFKRLMEGWRQSRALQEAAQEARTLWGEVYGQEVQVLLTGKLKDPVLEKRAIGLLMLGQAMLHTKAVMNDPLRYQHFWKTLILPGVQQAYQGTTQGWYDPEKFYVDALDLAGAVKLLPMLVQRDQEAISLRMVDIMQQLNTRFSGSYFAATPYWRLYERPMWRAVDRSFNSVQSYWFALLICDQLAAEMYGELQTFKGAQTCITNLRLQ